MPSLVNGSGMCSKRASARALTWFVELLALRRLRQELRAGVGFVELLGDVLRDADLLRECRVMRRRRHRAGLLRGRGRHRYFPSSVTATGHSIAAARNASPSAEGSGKCGIG